MNINSLLQTKSGIKKLKSLGYNVRVEMDNTGFHITNPFLWIVILSAHKQDEQHYFAKSIKEETEALNFLKYCENLCA